MSRKNADFYNYSNFARFTCIFKTADIALHGASLHNMTENQFLNIACFLYFFMKIDNILIFGS